MANQAAVKKAISIEDISLNPHDYYVHEMIGVGNFAVVKKIKSRTNGKTYVWKEISYAKLRTSEREMLRQEVNIMGLLSHEHIVRFRGHIIDRKKQALYIVMEYCEGGDLKMLLDEHKARRAFLEEDFVWRVLSQMASAIRHCHEFSDTHVILHRDLKPANVFLDAKKENAKIGDFGLATLLCAKKPFSTSFVGTPYYMSPEVLACSSTRQYSTKADIWALGCLVYELCAQRPPFPAKNKADLKVKVSIGEFERIPDRYSDSLQKLIARMLTLQEARRPTIQEVLQHYRVGFCLGSDGEGQGSFLLSNTPLPLRPQEDSQTESRAQGNVLAPRSQAYANRACSLTSSTDANILSALDSPRPFELPRKGASGRSNRYPVLQHTVAEVADLCHMEFCLGNVFDNAKPPMDNAVPSDMQPVVCSDLGDSLVVNDSCSAAASYGFDNVGFDVTNEEIICNKSPMSNAVEGPNASTGCHEDCMPSDRYPEPTCPPPALPTPCVDKCSRILASRGPSILKPALASPHAGMSGSERHGTAILKQPPISAEMASKYTINPTKQKQKARVLPTPCPTPQNVLASPVTCHMGEVGTQRYAVSADTWAVPPDSHGSLLDCRTPAADLLPTPPNAAREQFSTFRRPPNVKQVQRKDTPVPKRSMVDKQGSSSSGSQLQDAGRLRLSDLPWIDELESIPEHEHVTPGHVGMSDHVARLEVPPVEDVEALTKMPPGNGQNSGQPFDRGSISAASNQTERGTEKDANKPTKGRFTKTPSDLPSDVLESFASVLLSDNLAVRCDVQLQIPSVEAFEHAPVESTRARHAHVDDQCAQSTLQSNSCFPCMPFSFGTNAGRWYTTKSAKKKQET